MKLPSLKSLPFLCRGLRAGALALAAFVPALPTLAQRLDTVPRVAVVSAFDAELERLLAETRQPVRHRVHGVTFTTGELEGRPVVLVLSGISMTNAAMNTQLLLERFTVTHLVVSGIAGGVDPQLRIGDVTVPRRWASYLEALFARETAPGRYSAPSWMTDATLPAFGMIHPRPVEVRSARSDAIEKKFWFDVDPAMLAAAGGVDGSVLARCASPELCLARQPRLVVGGNGVSGQAFVDNAAFRDYTHRSFQAQVLDMETSAIGQVAYANGVPWIAFRSLSDLAGGGEGENEIGTFFRLAADNSARVVRDFLRRWKP